MDRFWKEWGPLVKVLGAQGFQDFCKQFGGRVVPAFSELVNIGRFEVVRKMVDAGVSLWKIKHVEMLGEGKIKEILKEIEEEGEREQKERKIDEYGE